MKKEVMFIKISFIIIILVWNLTCFLVPTLASESLENVYNNTSVAAINIRLYPDTSDYPSVIIGHTGEYGAKIYGDNHRFENTSIWFKEGDGGKYFCTYSTESIQFPLENEWEEIEPEITGEFVIKIYSSPRLSTYDRNGMTLNILNDTGLPAHILTYNDDQNLPRVKLGASKGNVLINGEDNRYVYGIGKSSF